MPTEPTICDALRSAFVAQADPVRAEGQQRYMKSAMPYYGLTAAEVRSVVKAAAAAHPLPEREAWLQTVRALWDQATHREERYAAIGLLRQRRYRAWATQADSDLLTLVAHLIVTGAWWDFVDEIAAHVVGELLRADRTTMTPVLRDWSRDADLWLRRSAILAQLGAKAATDTVLLRFAIEGSLDDRDFFARKAIGWALREYSKTDRAWVTGYVATQRRLSPLSQREALKWLNRQTVAASR